MKKNLLLILGFLVVGAIVLANSRNKANSTNDAGYQIGDKAMDFSLKNVEGELVSLSDSKEAKGFIVVFTCNTCPYSKMYEARIEALNLKYAGKGYPVIAINPNDKDRQPGDSFEAMVKRSKDKNYSFAYLYDQTQEVATAYGATRTPHVYLLNKSASDLIVAYIGAIDNNAKSAAAASTKYVEDAVDNLLTGKKIETNYTKAIGCTIKWRES